MPGLGRLVSKDPRDHDFLLPARRLAAKQIDIRLWATPGPILDQGETSECVGYSTWRYLTAAPVRNRPKETPHDIYKLAQANDEWDGDAYDGSSVRGAFKGLREKGYVTSFHWAFDCEAVIDHLTLIGPVVVGTNWFERMFEPDKDGYLIPEGKSDGGHAWLLIGCNRKRKNPDGTVGAVRMVNSWGPSWGMNGRAWVTFAAMDKLIKEDGEACVAVEAKIAKAMDNTAFA